MCANNIDRLLVVTQTYIVYSPQACVELARIRTKKKKKKIFVFQLCVCSCRLLVNSKHYVCFYSDGLFTCGGSLPREGEAALLEEAREVGLACGGPSLREVGILSRPFSLDE